MRNNKLLILALTVIMLLSFLLTGCGKDKNPAIVTLEYKHTPTGEGIKESKLYWKDFLYEIWLVEKDGNRLENYYKKNLGISYWDYEYEGSTMRQMAKISVLAGTVMDEILCNQAQQNNIKLSTEEVNKNQQLLEDIYSKNSVQDLEAVGLTKKVLREALDKRALADKYKKLLCKKFNIDEAAIRSSVNRKDYSSEEYYEQAVKEAIALETDLKFEPIYNKLKSEYDITIDYDYWDTITIGAITTVR